ncbi:MAG: DUF697 domain-containing protein [Catalinimonas sp.]
MRRQLKAFFGALSVLVLGAFLLFVFNQVMQVYTYASGLHPQFGQVVLWALTLLFVGLMIVPFVLYYRLPRAMPARSEDETAEAYHARVARRLARNRLLNGHPLETEADVREALAVLNAHADAIVRRTAKGVFLTTAVSQNGKLDALTVLVSQSKMVWDVAHVYYQRPAPRDILQLYGNVAAATFFAAQIEDMDVSEHIEPVVGTLLQGTVVKSVPLVGTATNIVMDSLLEGTVNAYLTLRVGVVTRRYCGAPSDFEPKQARKAAYAEAAGLLRRIVVESSGEVVTSVARASRRAGAGTVRSGVKAVERATGNVRTGMGKLFRSARSSPEAPE